MIGCGGDHPHFMRPARQARHLKWKLLLKPAVEIQMHMIRQLSSLKVILQLKVAAGDNGPVFREANDDS